MVVRRKSKVTEPVPTCPLVTCLGIIGGAWTPNILWYLGGQPRRFSELKDDIKGISAKILTARLKKLEADGIVSRMVVPSSPPTVEYSLTELGRELKPAMDAIVAVGLRLKELKGQSYGEKYARKAKSKNQA